MSAGEPSIQETRNFGKRAKDSRNRPFIWGTVPVVVDKQGVENPDETRMINSNRYPYRPIPKDSYDDSWNIKSQMTSAGMISSSRPLPIEEADIDYLMRKRDAEEYAGFVDWIGHKYPMNDPANREMMKQIIPSYFSERKALLQESIALQAKYANLRLVGPESENDLMFEYMVETGRVKIPTGPFHDPMKWMQNEYGNLSQQDVEMVKEYGINGQSGFNALSFGEQTRTYNAVGYAKGLFSPFQLLTYGRGPFAPNPDNMADIVGDSRLRSLGPSGAFQPAMPDYGTQYDGPMLGQKAREQYSTRSGRVENNYRSTGSSLSGVGWVTEAEKVAKITGTKPAWNGKDWS